MKAFLFLSGLNVEKSVACEAVIVSLTFIYGGVPSMLKAGRRILNFEERLK